jgi:hypothetical protein
MVAGGTANVTACAVLTIFKCVKESNIRIPWSDLYVLCNKKKVLTLALTNFVQNNPFV